MRWLYLLAAYLAAPLHAARLASRALMRREPPGPPLTQRFGFGPPVHGRPLWIHAASVGEMQLAASLVNALRARVPDVPILVTAFTTTGAARALALKPGITVRYLPYDLPGAVRRFLVRTRPRVAIILETELWPVLFGLCRRRGIPLMIASARLSSRSVHRYRRFATLFRPALRGALIAAQSPEDAERFRTIGAEPQRTHVIGNLKFDFTLPPDIAERGTRLRARYAPHRPLWVAGSTREGEDALVIAAHRHVREALPNALLALAPRHPQRFEAVAAALSAQGIAFVRHAQAPTAEVAASAAVVLVDSLGELLEFYAAADAAFVGGSLVPAGGHNLLEPAALGRPIATGPHQFNAEDVARRLFECGAARRVCDEQTLGETMIEWLRDPPAGAQTGARGKEMIAANRGALERLLALIVPLCARPVEH